MSVTGAFAATVARCAGSATGMAFAAIQEQVPFVAWLMLLANVFWAVAYDTAYAMVDRDDDLLLGMKTSAITFGRFDVAAIMICYAVFVGLMAWAGALLELGWPYYAGLLAAAVMAVYHYTLIRERDRMKCFAAFRHNNWLGACVFVGTFAAYLMK